MLKIITNTTKGFTLIELIIVLVIIGILSAIVYPSYTQYVTKTRRSEAQIALLDLAARMERYASENNNSFTDVTLVALHANPITLHGYYQLAILDVTPTTYSLHAIPLGAQATHDFACGTLTYNQLGQKGQTGKGTVVECWN